MAYYYVKNGGTATGDAGRAASQRTGSFAAMGASAYYSSVSAALSATTAPTNGDYILVSSVHSNNYGSNTTLAGPSSGAAIILMSVDDANCDAYLVGAYEASTPSTDLYFSGAWTLFGVTCEAGDDCGAVGNDAQLQAFDSTFKVTGSGDAIVSGATGSSADFHNCTFQLDNANARFLFGASDVRIFGGAVQTTSGGINNLFEGTPQQLLACGVDLVGVTGAIFQYGAATNDDAGFYHIDRCELASGVAINSETIVKRGARILVTNSSSDSDAAQYQFYQETFEGTVQDQDDSGIYRDETTAFENGTKVSLGVVTNANCGLGNPLDFSFPAVPADLSNAASDTLRVYFASTATLSTGEVWAVITYPDGTAKNQFNILSTRPGNILGGGSTHAADTTSTWKNGAPDLTGYNEYYLDIDTSSDPGANAFPTVELFVAKPSTTIYFDTTVDLV